MVLKYAVGWEQLPYPPYWEGSNNLAQGGQQVSPDGLCLYIWETGAKTGGAGRLAIYSRITNAWTSIALPAMATPSQFSSVTAKAAMAGHYVAFIDDTTRTLNIVNISGPALPVGGTQSIDAFDMVINHTLGVGIGLGILCIVSLDDNPGILSIPYGNRNALNTSAMMFANPDYPTRIYLCDPGVFGAAGFANGDRVGIVAQPAQGNGSQSSMPFRWYDRRGFGVPPPGGYCSGTSCLPAQVIVDGSFWDNPGTHPPFQSIDFNTPVPPADRTDAWITKSNNNFENDIMTLAWIDPTISMDQGCYVTPFWNGKKLAGVRFVAFNATQQLLTNAVEVNTPADFSPSLPLDPGVSYWCMGGNVYILNGVTGGAGRFYRLTLGSTFLNLLPLENWRRAFAQR